MDAVPVLTHALGWVLAVAATVTAWPQALRVLRTGIVTGIDPRSTGIAVATMAAWCVFTFARADIPALASSLGPLAAWLVVLTGLARHRQAGALTACGIAAAGVTGAITAGLAGHAGVVGTIAAVGSAAWALPQLVTACRQPNLPGVSAVAFWLIAVENAGWVAYAALTATPAYAVGPLVQGPAAAMIATRATRSHHRASCMQAHPAGQLATG